jgi:hypothetical protein
MNLIVATPQNVDATEFAFDDIKVNHLRFIEYSKRPRKLIHSFTESLGLYRLAKHVILFDFDKQRILYFVRFDIKKIFGHSFVVQEILWRDSQLTKSKFKLNGDSVSVYVFFNCLLTLAEGVGIATDSMQTPNGKRFWLDRIAQAFEHNLHVYLIDQNTKVKVEVTDDDDFKNKIVNMKTWTDSQVGTGRRVIIAKDRIWK